MDPIREFLKTVNIVDTETTSAEPKEAELIEVAGAKFNNGEWQIQTQLIKPIRDIPPEASAINHISNKMVRNYPTFDQQIDKIDEILSVNTTSFMVAHNAHFDREVLQNSYEKAYAIEKLKPFDEKNKWICTWRLARIVLVDTDFQKKKETLSYLRYSLNLNVSEDLPAHRAGADVVTCGRLFEKLLELAVEDKKLRLDEDIGQQVIDLCYKPYTINVWPFGKYKGKNLKEIPTDYYIWALENMDCLKFDNPKYDEDLANSVAEVLEPRLQIL